MILDKNIMPNSNELIHIYDCIYMIIYSIVFVFFIIYCSRKYIIIQHVNNIMVHSYYGT